MSYALSVNHRVINERFADVEALKAYLLKWNCSADQKFEVMDEDDNAVYDIDAFINLLLEGECVLCITQAMVDKGEDWADIVLFVC